MHEYFFANYRLLTDDGVANHRSTMLLNNFVQPLPYTHTYTLKLGDPNILEEKRAWALKCRMLYETEFFTIHNTGDGWAFVSTLKDEYYYAEGSHKVVLCSRDYGDITVFIKDAEYYIESLNIHNAVAIPLSRSIRAACEAGMVLRNGLPLHASLVEKDGLGVVFLGPSGMGKSTQAKLWEKYLNAKIIIGDRPGLRKIGDTWYGFGMPWDGKDALYHQDSVPIKALVWLEQAKENQIAPMSSTQAMAVMLKQAIVPLWDDIAMNGAVKLMGELSNDIPMYHLRCLPNENAVQLTYEAIRRG